MTDHDEDEFDEDEFKYRPPKPIKTTTVQVRYINAGKGKMRPFSAEDLGELDDLDEGD